MPKFCCNCRFCNGVEDGYLCHHPEAKTWDLVTGRPQVPLASTQRSMRDLRPATRGSVGVTEEYTACGPEGRWWEERPGLLKPTPTL